MLSYDIFCIELLPCFSYKIGPKKGSKKPILQRNDSVNDSAPNVTRGNPVENLNTGDDPYQELAARLESMMNGFFNKRIGVLKNNHASTSGANHKHTRAQRNAANDEDAVDVHGTYFSRKEG